jgi:hypothetical protein
MAASNEDMHIYAGWQKAIEATKTRSPDGDDDAMEDVEEDYCPWPVEGPTNAGEVTAQPRRTLTGNDARLSKLNVEQRRAHDIVASHLQQHLLGSSPQQLLMLILGEGGTGKSEVIRAISETFKEWRASALLAKTATTGVAASPIGGSTVHSWAALPIATPKAEDWITKQSKTSLTTRTRNIGPCKFWIVDEISMLTKETLTLMSQVTR